MMRFRHATLADCSSATGVAVVVDVLRAFTTAAYALDSGAEAVVCVRSVEEALAERDRRPGSMAMGEVDGRPIQGFDLSNSPAAMLATDVRGRTLVQRTTAGTQGVVGSAGADEVFAASFVCAAATARAVAALGPDEVTFVSTGVDHRDGEEDRACADYLEALLRGERPDAVAYLERARASDAARPFLAGDDPDFIPDDVDLAMSLDAVDLALRVHREDGRLVLRRA